MDTVSSPVNDGLPSSLFVMVSHHFFAVRHERRHEEIFFL